MTDQDPYDPEDRRVCAHCVGEEYLSDEIRDSGAADPCSYCKDSEVPTWSVRKLAERVHDAIQEHYERTPDQPSAYDQAMQGEFWMREGCAINETIEELAEVSDVIASDVRDVLDTWNPDTDDSFRFDEETPYAAEAHYEEKGIDIREWEEQWRDFELALKEESRYFNHRAAAILEEVFADIHTLQAQDGQEIIQTAGPSTGHTNIFRARAFQSQKDLVAAIERPDILLGPPPLKLAPAGRMNARGISVFYGASNPNIALAEVRPPVGSNVAVACFNFIEPLKLINLINLENHKFIGGSLFDPAYGRALEKSAFLRTLGNRLAKPVMPSDQDIDYIATQAVADYLANHASPSVDGIIFESVQSSDAGYNIVLFHRAARVKELEIPKGTEISSHLSSDSEEERYTHFSVFEDLPDDESQESGPQLDPNIPWPFPFLLEPLWDEHSDHRTPTLEVDTSRIAVHFIEAAKFDSRVRPVNRIRGSLKNPRG